MQKYTIEKFFAGKFFIIPTYQRDYAWETENIEDLFEDIFESIESGTSHYLGTFILSEIEDNKYYIVDGQQRLTTISLIILAVIENLATETEKIIAKDKYVYSETEKRFRLSLLGKNSKIFQSIIDKTEVKPDNKSQRLLLSGYKYICERITAIVKLKGKDGLLEFFKVLQNLDVMEFVEKDQGKAIRIFQTVNDRGKSLTNLEKAKSLLIYYSNRFLGGKLDDKVNEQFGHIFDAYNLIKTLAEDFKFNVINQKNFTEDFILRYHYLSYRSENFEYRATVDYVLDVFLKNDLKSKKLDPSEMERFITSYSTDLMNFFINFHSLLEKASKIPQYFKLFAVLEISANLFPITVKLHELGLLDQTLPKHKQSTFLDLIEAVDVRVYKTYRSSAEKNIFTIANYSSVNTPEIIANELINFMNGYQNDAAFKESLENRSYDNSAIKHIFVEYDKALQKKEFTINELMKINSLQPTLEHVYSQSESITFPSRGFESEEEYGIMTYKFGNYLLLEKSINSSIQDKSPDQKVYEGHYDKSIFKAANNLSAQIKTNNK